MDFLETLDLALLNEGLFGLGKKKPQSMEDRLLAATDEALAIKKEYSRLMEKAAKLKADYSTAGPQQKAAIARLLAQMNREGMMLKQRFAVNKRVQAQLSRELGVSDHSKDTNAVTKELQSERQPETPEPTDEERTALQPSDPKAGLSDEERKIWDELSGSKLASEMMERINARLIAG